MKKAIILLGHGSKAESGNRPLIEMAGMVEAISGERVIPAFLQLANPSLAEVIEDAAQKGATKIVVVPFFLYSGNHVSKDIPDELELLREKYQGIEIVMARHLDNHPKLADIVLERINEI
ncbi:MAG TPA: CbiX/SirB N-terminal domain-containing protein [Nitrospirota bacterium]|jgi:sirohydrochlorin cobaltochelatase